MTTVRIIDDWLNGVEKDLVDNYDRLGLRASGQWASSLEPFNNQLPEGFSIGILGEDYTEWIENGRLPNRDQSDESLKAWVGWAGSTFIDDWLHDKGLEDTLNPYAVSWKIALRGWQVPNIHNAGGLVSDVVTRERINDLNKSLGGFYINEIKTEIIKGLNGNK